MKLDLESIILERSKSHAIFKLGEFVGKDEDERFVFHTIEFGEYPKTYVGFKANDYLEGEWQRGALVATGKKYIGHFDNGKPSYNEEYMLGGQKFVRVKIVNQNYKSEFAGGGEVPRSGTPLWVRVEPITWIIRNWDYLPRAINTNGAGRARVMDVITEEAILSGIPFYPNSTDENSALWQNSTIRGYLNGYNVNNIILNGNTEYTAPNGGDFSDYNFLTEALTIETVSTSTKGTSRGVSTSTKEPAKGVLASTKEPPKGVLTSTKETQKSVNKKERKGYGVKVLDKPMTASDQIKFYIENGKSFMLHGPSGVGKTRRIEESDPDLVPIVLRNGILPEEVIGKTIYPNNDKTKVGFWAPPAWYTRLCEKCKREPDKYHVLFIDEITNVKPSEQSLVYHLVLNNSIGPNIGKLPKNVVVVAAGNSKEESEAAYNMPEPLFRRFDGHIELKPNVREWLEWGSEPSKKGKGRLKIHPLVASFVGSYGNQVFYSSYDSEEPPKFAIDPRGWEQISDIIYDNKGVIAKELIENKVGKEIATTFMAFAQKPPLLVEDIIDENYDAKDIPRSFDAKYALALSLRRASIDEIEQVREFVGRELGAEILSMFDVAWVGDDDEKAIYLAELQHPNKIEDESIKS